VEKKKKKKTQKGTGGFPPKVFPLNYLCCGPEFLKNFNTIKISTKN